MENDFKKENVGTREILTLRLHANKFMANGDFKNIDDIMKILSVNADIYKLEVIRTVENYDLQTGFTTHIIETETLPMWVADEITNAKKLETAIQALNFHQL